MPAWSDARRQKSIARLGASVGGPQIERLDSGAKPLWSTVKGFIKTPVILAILGGILFSQLGLTEALSSRSLGNSILATLGLLGALTTPLVAISIGYEIQLRAGSLRKPTLTVGIRLAFWIAIGLAINYFLIGRLLNLEAGFESAVMTMFILPPPFVMPLFMKRASAEDRNYVLNTLTLATIAALFAFAIISMLYPLL